MNNNARISTAIGVVSLTFGITALCGALNGNALISGGFASAAVIAGLAERYLPVAEVVGLLRMAGENPKHPIGWLLRSVLVLCDSLPASRIWGWYTFLKMHLLYALYC
mgnify:CR=1 FL=1